MKKIVVVSDSHGSFQILNDVVQRESPDILIFCGDGLADLFYMNSGNFSVFKVSGNVDRLRFADADEFLVENILGRSVFITHGDLYMVKNSYEKLVSECRSAGADLVIFGHTHMPLLEKRGGVTLFNPGALKSLCYGVIEVEGGMWNFTHKTYV